ncbi:translation initiation factor 2 subunit 2 [Nematocida displodere]|uniref:Translation initiation factor 2 subunit 2 n=1 Tax=Nematocida displodere TaxID=1805483 RepID=A0A177EDA6_9MICR|nr:translation initiation factor 2 subunit 2 [Nematocida displodere]
MVHTEKDAPTEAALEEELARVHVSKQQESSDEDSDFVPVGFDYDGFNQMAEGILHLEKPENGETVQTDVLSYEFLLARIEKYLKPSDQQIESKIKIPISIKRDGSTKTAFNITDVCNVIDRDVLHLKQFIEVELSVNSSIDGGGRLIIKGIYPEAQVQRLVRNYIKQYVTCGICASLSTALEKKDKLLFKKCLTCGATQTVNAIQQGYKALTTKRSVLRRKAVE